MSCKQMPDAGGNIIITHNTFFMLLAVKHVFVKAQEKMKKKLFSPNITEFIPFLGASTLYLRNGIKTSIYTQLRCRHTDKKERCITIVKQRKTDTTMRLCTLLFPSKSLSSVHL